MPHILYNLQGHEIHRRFSTTSFVRSGSPLTDRGEVVAFTRRSASRMRRYLRCCVADYRVFVTLTYPATYPLCGATCKRHLDSFVKRYQYAVHLADLELPGHERVVFSAFWFFEFQERGAPHFHLFVTHAWDKQRIARAWFEIVGSDDLRHYQAGTRVESLRNGRYGMCAYAGKYASKAVQKEVPLKFKECGRFWGIYGLRETHAATIIFDLKTGKNALHEAFLKELRFFLQSRVRETSIKRWGIGRAIVNVRTESALAGVKALFARYGARAFLSDDGYYETPTLGLLEEFVDEFSAA